MLENLKSEDYFNQRPHHNFLNKIFYSDIMKRYNPLHEWRTSHPLYHLRLANWYGTPPHASWVDGIIDYTYSKYNTNTIGHFHMHEDRKNKPFKQVTGGDKTFAKANFIAPGYSYVYYPKGCGREIKTYKECISNNRAEVNNCLDKKINIMEVCPKWVLETLRERKKFLMRATLIDNQTYRRAMKVSEYNKDRTLKDIKEDVKSQPALRSDSYWSDDRYNPTIYPSPDHNTNVNLGDNLVYSDILGGNRVPSIYEQRNIYMKNKFDVLKDLSQDLDKSPPTNIANENTDIRTTKLD